MDSNQQIAVEDDPTLAFTTIKIRSRELKMCFDFGAIGKAEQKLRAQGCQAYLIFAPWSSDIEVVKALFAASLDVYQPEILYADAIGMIGWDNCLDVLKAVQQARDAFKADSEDIEPADPTKAPAA